MNIYKDFIVRQKFAKRDIIFKLMRERKYYIKRTVRKIINEMGGKTKLNNKDER